MLKLSDGKKLIEEMKIEKFSHRQCDREFDLRMHLSEQNNVNDYEVLYLLTIADDIYPGRSFLLALCRLRSSLMTDCLIFESESSKFIKKVNNQKIIKHIDQRGKQILVMYFDKSQQEIQQIE